MYTLDIENRQHQSMLEHWRIGVGRSSISILWKNSNQPPQTTTLAIDHRGSRRCGWSSGGWRREGHHDSQVSDTTVVTVLVRWWR